MLKSVLYHYHPPQTTKLSLAYHNTHNTTTIAMPNYNFLYSSTPLGTSSADSSKKKPSLNPHFRAPCIYMNSPEPHLLNTRNPSIPVIDALTSRLGNPWVLSPTSLSAWRTLQTLTLCETFLCTDDDFARVGVFVAKHDDDAVCQGHIRDLRGLCASRGRNLVVLDLHEGGKKELVQGYGVNSLRVDLKGEITEAVVEGIIKWICMFLPLPLSFPVQFYSVWVGTEQKSDVTPLSSHHRRRPRPLQAETH